MKTLNVIGAYHLNLEPFIDNRGSFTKVLNSKSLHQYLGFEYIARQSIISKNTKKGTLRGLHFQSHPLTETKIVFCLEGTILDVFVDLRPDSPTYLKSETVVLEAKIPSIVVVPEQCAHGFQTLEDNSTLFYFSNIDYSKDSDTGVNPFSSQLKDIWPLVPTEISDRDLSLPKIEEFPWLKYY